MPLKVNLRLGCAGGLIDLNLHLIIISSAQCTLVPRSERSGHRDSKLHLPFQQTTLTHIATFHTSNSHTEPMNTSDSL